MNLTFEELKDKLLATELFIDNEYLNQYCELIIQNRDQKKIKYYTQVHHILPRCYFRQKGYIIDNSQYNLINLFYKDHILAHYYLCLCTEGKFQYKLANAFFHLVARKWKYENFNPETDLNEYQKLYENYCRGISSTHKGKKYSQYSKNKIRESKINGKNYNCTPVICIETQKSYESLSAAARECKCSQIYPCIKNPNITRGGYHWALLNDLETQEKLKHFVGKPKSPNGHHVQVICLETKQVFSNVVEAKKWLRDKGDIHGALKSSTHKAGGYTWEIYDIFKDYSNIEIPESPRIKRIEIICIETGEYFPNIASAAEKMGINLNNLYACVAGRQKTAKGYHFKKL